METDIYHIRRLLPRALRVDRRRAQRRLDRIGRDCDRLGQESAAGELARLADSLERSAEIKAGRFDAFPALTADARLPISDRQEAIIEAIRCNPVTIVSGATGSGKTTQIPKYCVAAGLGRDGRIGCTQPRRIAAVSVAERISREIGLPPGRLVGHKIRFDDKTADSQLIKIMTDGILLAEARQDRWLNEYDALVIDEAHERSLNIDFILGLLKKILEKRGDLKVVITSATIDTEKFSEAFDRAPVVEVSGRMFPVRVDYRPPGESGADGVDEADGYVEQAVTEVERICRAGPGDILVFMPTAQDILDACAMIEGRRFPKTVVLPLFARLPGSAQAAVFAGRKGRKIIVATNIAETSLTIPGIRYVIDTGLARISYYNPRTRVTSLAVRKISKSSALQRQGRCGRVSEGVCVRLYAEKDFEARHMYTPPEILRANLAEVVLRMMSLGLGHIRRFPFVDPPMGKSIIDGYDTLVELGAVALSEKHQKSGPERHRLTKRGRLMAGIPVDPRLSRILIEAGKNGCVEEAAVIVAALSVPDPRTSSRSEDAAAARAEWTHPDSDFITLLNIWEAARNLKEGDLKRFCRKHYLSYTRMREWRDVCRQIRELVKTHGLQPRTNAGRDTAAKIDRRRDPDRFYATFHRAILSGYLSNIAQKKDKNIYQAGQSKEVMLFPGSALFNREKQWIVAAELVETSRLYARTAAAIEPDWIVPLAGELCRHVYSNPRWSKSRGEVVADRRTLLFGLTVAEEERLAYGPINPQEAAEIFIRDALVSGDIEPPPPFMSHNLALLGEVARIEDRLRRRDFLVTDEVLFDFYRKRLDENVVGSISLADFIEKQGGDGFLRLEKADTLRKELDEQELARFPETIAVAGQTLACEYLFDPADEKDGLTVKIPARLVGELPPERFDWLVPGLLPEKIAALIKGLPKEYRRKLVPLNRTVEMITRDITPHQRPLLSELSDLIYRRFSLLIPASAWQPQALPLHLRPRLVLVDGQGRTLRVSRNAVVLNEHLPAGKTVDELAGLRKVWQRDHIDWRDFSDLPESIPVDGKTGDRQAFPALVAEGNAVHLRLFDNRGRALAAHVQGVRRLFENSLGKELKLLKKDLRLPPAVAGTAVYFGGAAALEAALAERVRRECLCRDIRSSADFERHAAAAARKLYDRALRLRQIVEPVLIACQRLRETLFRLSGRVQPGGPIAAALAGIEKEVAGLLPDRFVEMYDDYRLEQLPRYLEAARIRAERAAVDYPRHRQKADQVAWAETTLERLVGELKSETTPARRAAVEAFLWMVEEYKISVFAQEVKTDGPVSAERLRRQVRKIDRMV